MMCHNMREDMHIAKNNTLIQQLANRESLNGL